MLAFAPGTFTRTVKSAKLEAKAIGAVYGNYARVRYDSHGDTFYVEYKSISGNKVNSNGFTELKLANQFARIIEKVGKTGTAPSTFPSLLSERISNMLLVTRNYNYGSIDGKRLSKRSI
jgi:hypothetical protein